MNIKIIRLPHHVGLPIPAYAKVGDAGVDLYAANYSPIKMLSTERVLVPTGLVMAIPEGYEGQVRTRSGMALKRGLVVANSPGTIDSGYRGEISVILYNISFESQEVHRGDRIAQLVIAPVVTANFVEDADLGDTDRGAGGFGSTGTR
jgi:dUTP pyrophosphatase